MQEKKKRRKERVIYKGAPTEAELKELEEFEKQMMPELDKAFTELNNSSDFDRLQLDLDGINIDTDFSELDAKIEKLKSIPLPELDLSNFGELDLTETKELDL